MIRGDRRQALEQSISSSITRTSRSSRVPGGGCITWSSNTETDEMLKIALQHLKGAREDAQEVQGHGLGPEPHLQKLYEAGVRTVRRRAVRVSRGTSTSITARRRRAAGRDRADVRRRPRAVHHRGRPVVAQMDSLAGAEQPTGSHQDLQNPGVRRLAIPPESEDSKYLVSRCRGSSRGCPMAPRPCRSRSSTSRRRPRERSTTSNTWANAHTRWR